MFITGTTIYCRKGTTGNDTFTSYSVQLHAITLPGPMKALMLERKKVKIC